VCVLRRRSSEAAWSVVIACILSSLPKDGQSRSAIGERDDRRTTEEGLMKKIVKGEAVEMLLSVTTTCE